MNANPNRAIQIQDLGQMPYAEAWELQKEMLGATVARKVANRDLPPEAQVPTDNYLLLVEHPPVYTLGKSGNASNLIWDEAELQRQGISYYHVERGGDITYHGPGQLVAYPIFDLENFFTDIHKYLRLLEEAVIRTLAHYGLAAGRIEGLTGVWVDVAGLHPRKVCAMGIKCSRWVSMHGLALNVNTNLAHFGGIVPCGIADQNKGVTSLQAELGREVPLQDVKEILVRELAACFGAAVLSAHYS